MAYPSTFADLQTIVVNNLRLDATADAQKIKDAINVVYADAALDAGYLESSSAGTALVANASSQALPAAVVDLDYIVATRTDNTTTNPLIQISLGDLLARRANNAAQAGSNGAPSHYTLQQSTVQFWPNAIGGEVFTYYGRILPTALSGASDVPTFPEPYATDVLGYGGCTKMAEFKKDPDAAYYRGLYQQSIQKLRAFRNRRQGASTGQLKVAGAPSYPPHDPSQDAR